MFKGAKKSFRTSRKLFALCPQPCSMTICAPELFSDKRSCKTNILYNYLGYFYHIIIEIFLSKKIDLIWYCNVFFNREYNKSYTSSSSSIHLEVNRSSIILNYLGYTRGGLGAGPPPTRAPALRRGGRHGGLI